MVEEFDEEEKARRRKDQIEYRNKKRTSNIFMFFATIFEIIETFLVVGILLILSMFILSKIFAPQSEAFSNALGIVMIVMFFAGLVVGFMIYRRIITWVIKKWKLEDKLLDDVLVHYIKKTEDEMEEELKR